MNNSLASMSAMSATLPPGWEQKMTSEGKVYYEHHGTKTTSWTIPDRLVVLPSTYGNANSGCCGDCVPITLEPTGVDTFKVEQPGCCGCGLYCLGFECFDCLGALPTRTFTRNPGTNDFQSPGLMGPDDNQTATIISSNSGTGWFATGYGCRVHINGSVYDAMASNVG